VFTLEKFKESRIVVNCRTLEDAKMFFKYLKSKDITWCNGMELSENNTYWLNYKELTCYEYAPAGYAGSGGIRYGDVPYFAPNAVVNFEFVRNLCEE
jgi:hypothetical protein